MIRKWLSNLLMILIVLQSVTAFADVHQLVQTETEHLEFAHEHSDYTVESHNLSSQSSDTLGENIENDCQHCCHCHGVNQFYIPSNENGFNTRQLGKIADNYNLNIHSHIALLDTPPPNA